MTLGSVGKGSYAEFAGKRKLLLVPFVGPVRDDEELKGLVATYWEEAFAQVRKLEVSLGQVGHVFHEGSVGDGEEAAKVLEQGNPAGFPHVRKVLQRGAVLEPTEDVEVLRETMDLHRCMLVVQASRSVQERLVEWFEDARRRRYAAIAQRIGEALDENGVGVLVISPDHRVQFENDIQVIYVAPPSLDRVNKWLRDHPPQAAESQTDAPRSQEAAAGDGETPDEQPSDPPKGGYRSSGESRVG